jgi:hypothetical protein
MTRPTRSLLKTLLLVAAMSAALPAMADSWVYRGALSDGGIPAEGEYGFRLTFYDREFGGKALAPSALLDAVAVREGAFSATLDLEPALQQRDTLWLAVEVRDASGSYVPMAQREAVRPKAATGACWDILGNAGISPATHFLGTTDGAALRVQSTGNVGINTSTPQGKLHVRNASAGAIIPIGGSAGVFESSGHTYVSVMSPATSERGILFGEPGSAADGGVIYNNLDSGALQFRTGGNLTRMQLGVADVDGALPGQAVPSLRLIGSGSLVDSWYLALIGSPGNESLHFGESGRLSVLSIADLAPGDGGRRVDVDGTLDIEFGPLTVSNESIGAAFSATADGNLTITGIATKPGGGTWAAPSDARLKRNVAPLTGALDRLLALRGVNFEYANPDAGVHPAGVHTGFVAQEVQKVFPHWVAPGSDGFLTVGPTGFEALTVESLRELAQENALLQAENDQLRARVQRIERALSRLPVAGAK